MKRRIFLIFTGIILLMSGSLVSGAEVYTKTGPGIYVNDEAWHKSSAYRPHIIAGECYVPVSVFEAFAGYEVTYNTAKTEYKINDSANGRYISFSTAYDENNHLALTYDKAGISVRTYKLYGGELYVPLELVAETMKLSVTLFVSENDSSVFTVRISDGSEKKTITELLREYDPSMLKIPSEESPGTDSPGPAPDPSENEPGETPGDNNPAGEETDNVLRTVYLTFENSPNEYTEQILDILDEYGYKATFFITGKNISQYADLIVRIKASGHSLGLQTMSGDERKFDADIYEFISELQEENNVFMRLLKQKFHIIRAPKGSRSNNFYIDGAEKQLVEEYGYIIWDWNIDSYDNGMYWYKNVVKRVTDNISLLTDSAVRFVSSKVTVDALPEILDFTAARPNYTVREISPSDPEINFMG